MSSSPTTYSRTTTFSTLIYLLKTLYLIPFKVSERPWKLADDVPVVIAVSEKRSHAGHLFTSVVFFIQNTVLPCRQSFDVLQRAKSVSAQWFPQRDWAHWFVVRSLTAHSGLQCGVRLCAIVCTEDFDSTQLFTVRSPTQPSGLQCRVRTLHSGLQCGVQLCAIVCTLQCGVRICAVVCSAESDSTQWFAVCSPTLRSGFFCRVESDFVQ